MFRGRTWGMLALIAGMALIYIGIELVRFHPRLLPLAGFLVALATASVATVGWIVCHRIRRFAEAHCPHHAMRDEELAEVLAFENSSTHLRLPRTK